MNYVKIGDEVYDVIVTNIERAFKVKQSDNAGGTLAEGGEETLDPIGTLIYHIVTFKRRKGKEKQFDQLWDFVSTPHRDGVWVEIVYNQETIKYKAKFPSGSQALQRIDTNTGKVYWGEFTLSIVPTKAQVLPD